MAYDFKNLSPNDFEELVRDLLQKHYSVHLESFITGKDQGIDLRYSNPKGTKTHIIQCKHYANSSISTLIKHLKNKELPKVIKLSPKKYSVATSLGLTPKNKNDIKKIFKAYCQSEADIFGKSDLNNLISKHPAIEKQHFKLWLNSTQVLEKILHAKMHNRLKTELQRIRNKIKLYVINPSFSEALKILNEKNFLIISGIPGIGKSTLAEVLFYHFLNFNHEGFIIRDHIKEGLEVFNTERNQIFLYDDFLGMSDISEKLYKNEDSELLNFISTICSIKNKKLILTTREYILHQAQENYEKIGKGHLDLVKYVLDLESYTKLIRAKILYNHLYFSELPKSFENEIIKNKNYLSIINHENYSPRIIESMCNPKRLVGIKANEFFKYFIENLDNPSDLWKHAFEKHISDLAKKIILVVFTFGGEIEKKILSEVCKQFAVDEINFHTEFNNACRELEGSFLFFSKDHVGFHNASINDFIRETVFINEDIVLAMLSNFVFPVQLATFWGTLAEGEKIPQTRKFLVRNPKRLFQTLRICLNVKYEGRYFDLAHLPHYRAILCFEILEEFKSENFRKLFWSYMETLPDKISYGINHLKLLEEKIRKSSFLKIEEIQYYNSILKICIFKVLQFSPTYDEFVSLKELALANAEIFSDAEMVEIADIVNLYLNTSAVDETYDANTAYEVEEIKDELEAVSDFFDLPHNAVFEEMEEIFNERAYEEDRMEENDLQYSGASETSKSDDNEDYQIDQLFETLK